MEGDIKSIVCVIFNIYFNPLPPHGGRPVTVSSPSAQNPFQSTPSAWRETPVGIPEKQKCNISIHSLRMEGDRRIKRKTAFNSISIHSLRMEGDLGDMVQFAYDHIISIHSLRMEGDLQSHHR